MQKFKNKELVHVLEKSFTILQGYLCILIQAIFDNLYSMPTGLRILCKLIHNMAKKKVYFLNCSKILLLLFPTNIVSFLIYLKSNIMEFLATMYSGDGFAPTLYFLNTMVFLMIFIYPKKKLQISSWRLPK